MSARYVGLDENGEMIRSRPLRAWAAQCRGVGRYAVRCKRRTLDWDGYCYVHRNQAASPTEPGGEAP